MERGGVLLALSFIFLTFFIQETRVVVAVPAQVAWTDTGLEVEEGEALIFEASGTISLQAGNPEGFCDPEGLDLKTAQQPLIEEKLGMLIGKVARLLSTEIDPETKEIKRLEEERLFPIGRTREIEMPLSGRLYLGINENVVEDNSGEFLVVIRKFRK
ncbi:MAG: hypothetical protein N3B16_06730 [Candidatus Aminicenantes bacterium]|nr:hypothetical protein [Candidatus Aminicenantes bacterium]